MSQCRMSNAGLEHVSQNKFLHFYRHWELEIGHWKFNSEQSGILIQITKMARAHKLRFCIPALLWTLGVGNWTLDIHLHKKCALAEICY